MTDMLDEIYEQPEAVRTLLLERAADVSLLAEEIKSRNIEFVYIAARGSSDHAAVYCKYVLEINNGLPVALANPSAFTLYGTPPQLNARCLVIGISQSGAGPDVIEVLRVARAGGALTACIVNTPDSPLASVTEFPLHLGLGREKSVAATKTYTCSLAVVALLSAALAKDVTSARADLDLAIGGMETTLKLDIRACSIAKELISMKECVVLARGFNQATAQEAALKLMETCYVGARAYSGADFLHGPIAQMGSGLPCILIAPSGKTLPSMVALARNLSGRSEHLVCISDDPGFLALGHSPLQISKSLPEWVSPLAYVIPAQLFACHLSLQRGLNPDAPRGLNKVTMTV